MTPSFFDLDMSGIKGISCHNCQKVHMFSWSKKSAPIDISFECKCGEKISGTLMSDEDE